MDDRHADDDCTRQQPGLSRLFRPQGEEEEGNRRTERGAGRVTEPVQQRARGGGDDEHRKRRAAARNERQRCEGGKDDAERIETP
jgi:hypothetical protein